MPGIFCLMEATVTLSSRGAVDRPPAIGVEQRGGKAQKRRAVVPAATLQLRRRNLQTALSPTKIATTAFWLCATPRSPPKVVQKNARHRHPKDVRAGGADDLPAWLTRRLLPSSSYPSKRSTAAGMEAGSVKLDKGESTRPAGCPCQTGEKLRRVRPLQKKALPTRPVWYQNSGFQQKSCFR